MLGICRHRKHPVRYGTGCQISWSHTLKEEENKEKPLGREQKVNKERTMKTLWRCMVANQPSYVIHSAPENGRQYLLWASVYQIVQCRHWTNKYLGLF